MIHSQATVSDLVHRQDILDNITSLAMVQAGFDNLLRDTSYNAGYQAGYAAALRATAKTLGVYNEFRRLLAISERNDARNVADYDYTIEEAVC